MTGIWTNTGAVWQLGSPQPFDDEATLHNLIRDNPQLLPLAGSPRLTVLGSEIQLGTGYSDILAVESSGRPAIIEVKLSSNRDARRAVISQVLTYAAFLRGFDVKRLERGPLRGHLLNRGCESILDAVKGQDQEGAVEAASFGHSLQECLDQGSFRLVLVLDKVSTELERVVAYLDALTLQALTIDLVTLSVYELDGTHVVLPQRVSPDIDALPGTVVANRNSSGSKGTLSDGIDAFRASIKDTTGATRALFEDWLAWADQIASLRNISLFTFTGTGRYTLLPRLMPDKSGLVTIWNDQQQPYISVWRSVFKRRAPGAMEAVELAIAPNKLGQGNTISELTPELMEALTIAYREASESVSRPK